MDGSYTGLIHLLKMLNKKVIFSFAIHLEGIIIIWKEAFLLLSTIKMVLYLIWHILFDHLVAVDSEYCGDFTHLTFHNN